MFLRTLTGSIYENAKKVLLSLYIYRMGKFRMLLHWKKVTTLIVFNK